MMEFCKVFLLSLLQICAGCAGTCAGFGQGLLSEKYMKNKGLKRVVQGVHGLENIPLCVRVGAGARTRESACAWKIFKKPCTPCTVLDNLLKKRKKVIFKPCTNPEHYPAHSAQL